MKKYILITAALGLCLFALGFTIFNTSELSEDLEKNNAHFAMATHQAISIDGINIEAPTTVQNLTLYILTGEEKVKGRNYKTLTKAMASKEVVVNETGQVNELSIDNNSDEYIFIHSGDIVKGGKQDRTISYDVIVPPHAQNVSLESFCVEQGRWQQRSGEEVASFGSNSKMLSSRDLKLAAKHTKNQSEVWSKVSEQKERLSKNISEKTGNEVDVSANASNTSLQLALESKDLENLKKEFYIELEDLINTPKAIGYAYSINGEMYGVEIYNNEQLFKDLWDKILESVIVEAISKQGEEATTTSTSEDVLAFIQAVKKDEKGSLKEVNESTNFSTVQNAEGNVVFTTEDADKKEWIHRSYMKSDITNSKEIEESQRVRQERHER